jgi:uncharacterized Zn finger protein (UPF0148 family)
VANTLTYTAILNTLACADCGMPFAVPADFERRRREDGKTFYCPQGCKNVYTKSEVDRLREQLRWAERQRDWAQTAKRAADDQARTSEYRRRAAVGQLTKMRKRVANGVCPCCQRTFANLAAHIAEKHPYFKDAANDNE